MSGRLFVHAIGCAAPDAPTAEAPALGLRDYPLVWVAAGPLGAWATLLEAADGEGAAEPAPVAGGAAGAPPPPASRHHLGASTAGASAGETPPAGPWRWDRADLLAHHRLVETLCATGAILPARFGAVLQDETELAARLRAREAALLAALEHVRGCREIAVTVLWGPGQEKQGTIDGDTSREAHGKAHGGQAGPSAAPPDAGHWPAPAGAGQCDRLHEPGVERGIGSVPVQLGASLVRHAGPPVR